MGTRAKKAANAKHLKVCYIYQDQYPWDIRVEKIVFTLAEAGLESHIVCRNRAGLPVEERLAERVYAHRLSKGFDLLTRSLFNFPAFFSPFWLDRVISVVREQKIDLILIRDLPLGPMAYFAGRRTGVPVLMDMAENYPAMLEDTWTFRGPSPTDYLLKNPALLRKMERWLFPKLDGILVVSEASQHRVQSLTNPQMPVFIVGNTPRIAATHSDAGGSIPLVQMLRNRNGIKLIYVGGMEETRGLDIVVRAIPHLKGKLADFLFVVVGKGSSEQKLKRLAGELGVENHLYLADWMDRKYVPSIVAACDLCIVPHYVTEHTDTTIPNKIFDYMLQKKPVLVSHARSLRDIVERSGCGKVYQDKDPAALAQAILELRDASLRSKLGEAGFAAVQNQYNWERDRQVLLNAVEQVALTGKNRR